MLLEGVMSAYQLLITSCMTIIGCVSFLLGVAVADDLRNMLRIAKKNIKFKKNRSEGVKKLYQFIEFQSTGRELSFGMN